MKDVHDTIKQLLGTLVKISQLLYLPDSGRNPKTVLQLYNVNFVANSCELISNPTAQARDRWDISSRSCCTCSHPVPYGLPIRAERLFSTYQPTSYEQKTRQCFDNSSTIQWNNHFERLSEVTHVKLASPLTTHQSVLTTRRRCMVGDRW